MFNDNSEKLPKVYVVNTFFIQTLIKSGYKSKKVHVHINNNHWTIAIIMTEQTIKYYDSLKQPINEILNTLANYLENESLEKRKQSLDTKGFTKQNVANIPQQQNNNHFGEFTCIISEHITADKKLNFSEKILRIFEKS